MGKNSRLEENSYRLITQTWKLVSSLRLLPKSQNVKRLSRWYLRRLQGFHLYGVAAKKALNKHIQYGVATKMDAADIAIFDEFRTPSTSENTATLITDHIKEVNYISHTLIAKVDDTIAGVAIVRCFPKNTYLYSGWWIFSMQVRMCYRRAGIGEGLVKLAIKKARAGGAKRINLLVFDQNLPAINLYRKIGFMRVNMIGLDEKLEDEVRQGQKRRIIMAKFL